MTQPATKVPARSTPAPVAATAPKTKVIVTAPVTAPKVKAPPVPTPPATIAKKR